MRSLPLLRVLLAATAAATALALPSTPASASAGCIRIVWTEHLLYDGPPGPDVWVMLPTVVMGVC